MENDNYQAKNIGCTHGCGRPFPKAKPCECQFWNGCATEYPFKAKGCIRNKNPECPYNCVIPSVTVETIDGISNLADCFVHVVNINTTYYIDDKHRITIIWAGPVETEIPADVQTDQQLIAFAKGFNLRSQFLYAKFHSSDLDADGIVPFYFDKTGEAFWAGEFNEAKEELI